MTVNLTGSLIAAVALMVSAVFSDQALLAAAGIAIAAGAVVIVTRDLTRKGPQVRAWNAHLAGVARAAWEAGYYRTPTSIYVYCPLCRQRIDVDAKPSKTANPTKLLDAAMRGHLSDDCESTR